MVLKNSYVSVCARNIHRFGLVVDIRQMLPPAYSRIPSMIARLFFEYSISSDYNGEVVHLWKRC